MTSAIPVQRLDTHSKTGSVYVNQLLMSMNYVIEENLKTKMSEFIASEHDCYVCKRNLQYQSCVHSLQFVL